MKEICVIAVHLLLLNQIAQSFVLLTANIDDIKKLANKFVSESLAEKIADFIARATEQIITNVSDENDSEKYQDISKENNDVYNIGRVRYPKKAESLRPKPKRPVRKTTKTSETTKRATVRNKPKRFGVNLKSVENITKKVQEKKYVKVKPMKQYSYAVKERIKPKIYEDQPPTTEIPSLDSTIGVAEKLSPKDQPNLKANFISPNRFRLTSNSKENETLDPFDFENIQKVLTTRKERNEFDQYDNVKYPKAQLIATSGPVVLPKIPYEWGKEKEGYKKNKYWD